MKAVVCTKYGPPEVLEIREIEKPAPKDSEVLIRVRSVAVNTADCKIRGLRVPFYLRLPMRFVIGFTKPKQPILGMYCAGTVEETGHGVSRFKKGDGVCACAGMAGAYVEYLCVPENGAVVPMPPNATFEEAAALPFGGATALYFLRKANIQVGQSVLVYGASGAVGTGAVQLAKHFGAAVTGVCSTENLALVKSLGAGRALDYTKEDFTGAGESYDIVFDAVGKLSRAKSRKALKPGGRFVSVMANEIAKCTVKDLLMLNELFESGQLNAVLDRCYPMEQVAEAHRYVDLGHKKGNVVLTVGE